MQSSNFFSLEQIIDRQPLTIALQTPLVDAIALMQNRGNSCRVNAEEVTYSNSSCVLTANNGIEAVAAYANNQDAIALIIMDIMMPGMDGKTAIRTLRQIDSNAKIIAISGLITNQEIFNELDGEVMAFLSKPYSNEELLETVYEIVSN